MSLSLIVQFIIENQSDQYMLIQQVNLKKRQMIKQQKKRRPFIAIDTHTKYKIKKTG